ncbi:hypothetical protein SUGI_1041620 [Cryptomeria japonica]|uniref:transcriptional adapter ADA2 isoform X2 n=1 Tax=Cryptomeria japonica TaxID=3369 RepID=UPI0024148E69|nr:transcriptional adapter ADA2 isoform X2 [Cryptomeria japonica]GLJ49285.1 hypothetical protein SUGI_1041620 [Cryptomeria japonica]
MGRSRGVLASTEDDPSQRSKRRRIASGGDNLESVISGTNEGKRALYHCNYCSKDISGTIRIKCAKCPDFDLCVECFSVGVEVTPHKSNHNYKVMDNLSFPLFHPDWNADEEMLLLEGVEMYGLGNWGVVAEHVGTKTKVQCYDHYMKAYINSPCYPLPDMSHVIGKTKAELLTMAKVHGDGKKGFSVYGDAGISKTPKEESSISPLRIKVEDINKDASAEGRSPSNFTAGTEGENAESKANSLTGNSTVTSSLGAGKMASNATQVKEGSNGLRAGSAALTEDYLTNRSIGGKKPKPSGEDCQPLLELSGYNPKRQEFEPEYDNDAELPLAEMEFKENDSETDRELKLRMLHIYYSRLDERKRRKDFILKMDLLNSRHLEKLHTKEERELFQRFRVFMRFHSQEEHYKLLEDLNKERKIKQKIEELQEYYIAGCHTFADVEQLKAKREAEASNRKSKESGPLSATAKAVHRANRSVNRERGEGDSSPGCVVENQKARNTTAQGASGNMCPVTTGQKGTKKSLLPWDIKGLPGAELLSLTEQQLCSQNRLFPEHYRRIKNILVLKSTGGPVKRADAYRFFKIDSSKVDKVYDFLSRMGWIQEPKVRTCNR